MFGRGAANTYFIVFSVTHPGIEHTSVNNSYSQKPSWNNIVTSN